MERRERALKFRTKTNGKVTCPDCKGTGKLRKGCQCDMCQGSGEVEQ